MRACSLGLLTIGLVASGIAPAAAQGDPVFGLGNLYFLAGAGNTSGQAAQIIQYGDPDDDVYFGDLVDAGGAFGGDGVDDAVVRRGNTYIVRGQGGAAVRRFVYGDVDDEVYVGDWDGDGTDTLMVRRGNTYFINDDLSQERLVAERVFSYGDPNDEVYAGNWDGNTAASETADPITTDTLMVRRDDHYFVRNTARSGVADYDLYLGDPDDEILIGDWAVPPVFGDDPATPAVRETRYVLTPGESGDYADQLAVRRDNVYFESAEVWLAEEAPGAGIDTDRSYAYGNPDDWAFAALLPWTYDLNGTPDTLLGDGLAVRR